ncbi:MAG: hypothetical protein QW802_01325 [Candidatus Altiarchaeota archaeon]
MILLRNKKSQAAVEYLQTYGWAILVVLLIAIAIWQMGILTRSKVNTASGFTVIQVIPQSIKYTASGNRYNNFTFTIMNAGNMRVKNIYTMNVSGDCSKIFLDYTFYPYPNEDTCNKNRGGVWIPCGTPPCDCRVQVPVHLDPGSIWLTPRYTNCEPLVKGEQFEVYITFEYQERAGKDWITKKDSGVIRGYAE